MQLKKLFFQLNALPANFKKKDEDEGEKKSCYQH
jgi:hypothetical protein